MRRQFEWWQGRAYLLKGQPCMLKGQPCMLKGQPCIEPLWLKGADGPTAGGRHLAHPAACARPRPAATVSATSTESGALHDLTVAAGRARAQRVNLEGR